MRIVVVFFYPKYGVSSLLRQGRLILKFSSEEKKIVLLAYEGDEIRNEHVYERWTDLADDLAKKSAEKSKRAKTEPLITYTLQIPSQNLTVKILAQGTKKDKEHARLVIRVSGDNPGVRPVIFGDRYQLFWWIMLDLAAEKSSIAKYDKLLSSCKNFVHDAVDLTRKDYAGIFQTLSEKWSVNHWVEHHFRAYILNVDSCMNDIASLTQSSVVNDLSRKLNAFSKTFRNSYSIATLGKHLVLHYVPFLQCEYKATSTQELRSFVDEFDKCRKDSLDKCREHYYKLKPKNEDVAEKTAIFTYQDLMQKGIKNLKERIWPGSNDDSAESCKVQELMSVLTYIVPTRDYGYILMNRELSQPLTDDLGDWRKEQSLVASALLGLAAAVKSSLES